MAALAALARVEEVVVEVKEQARKEASTRLLQPSLPSSSSNSGSDSSSKSSEGETEEERRARRKREVKAARWSDKGRKE